MPQVDLSAPTTTPPPGASRWSRFVAAFPMRIALVAVGVVWLLGCVWSFQEQSAFAASRGFTFPHLLPLVIDGFAASMAGVSWAASLDARPAIPARLATVIAVGASSASNGVWAWLRARHDPVTVVLGVAVPVAAAMAFEVLLAEMRRQVQRGRGATRPRRGALSPADPACPGAVANLPRLVRAGPADHRDREHRHRRRYYRDRITESRRTIGHDRQRSASTHEPDAGTQHAHTEPIAPVPATADELSQGLHASTECEDQPGPWGDASSSVAGRAGALAAAVACRSRRGTAPLPAICRTVVSD
jgi:Protein of unknown function (DUF2637)